MCRTVQEAVKQFLKMPVEVHFIWFRIAKSHNETTDRCNILLTVSQKYRYPVSLRLFAPLWLSFSSVILMYHQ